MFVHLRAQHAAMARQRTTVRGALVASPMASYSRRSAKGYFAVIFSICVVLLAETGHPARADGLALRQLITQALSGNKDLQAARFATAQARARLVQAGVLPNPRLELTNKNDALFKNEGEYTASIGFSQQFPVAGRIARQKDVARVDIDLAVAEIKEAEWKLAGDVANGACPAVERQGDPNGSPQSASGKNGRASAGAGRGAAL
jgi:outer membrane protein TolC